MKKFFKKESFVFSIFLISVICLFFYNVIFFGKTLVPSHIVPGAYPNGAYKYNGGGLKEYPVKDPGAFAWHHEPAMELNHRSYSSKEIPLWNPYNAAGEPQAADGQSSAFFPIISPLFVSPSPILWDLFMLSRLFIAGLFTYLLARKLNISKQGSTLAALAFTFCGYFISYLTMMHLSVEALISAALYFAEKLFQKADVKNFLYLSIVLALTVLAGMPESTFLLFIFTVFYYLFRAATSSYNNLRPCYRQPKQAIDTGLIRKSFSSLKKPLFLIFSSVILALALSAILILPFAEYLKLSWNNHPATKGLIGLSLKSAVSLIVPQFLGAVGSWNKGNPHQVLGYVGVIPLILAFCVNKKKRFVYFFAGFSILIFLKSFNFPAINLLGYLPFINVVTFPKYASPFFALSIGVLAGYSLDSIKFINLKKFFAIYGIWCLIVLFFIGYYWKDMALFHYRTFVSIKVLWAFILASFLAGLVVSLKKGWLKERLTKTAIIILVAAELFSYIPKQRNTRHYSYIKPPYVNFLQKDNEAFRVTGIDKVLYPNTNIGFNLFDYRSVNALHINRYMDMIKLFSDRRMLGHVTGDENIDWNNQIIDLFGIKYILAEGDLSSQLVKTFVNNTRPKLKEKTIEENGIKKEAAVFTKPGVYKFKIRAPLAAKGISFTVLSNSSSKLTGKNMLVVEQSKNKKIIYADKKPQKIYFDLSFGKNHIAAFNFKASFPKGIEVLVKNVQFDTQPSKMGRYELVYQKDINIYKNKGYFPRAFLSYDAKNMGNKSSVFRTLRHNKTNLAKTVLLEKPLKEKIGPAPFVSGKAKIVGQKNNSVKIEAQTDKNALLFLSDAYFPGWKAYVDGRQSRIYIADYLFRAVYLPKGRHSVVFKYQPSTFFIGSIISGLTLFVVLLLLGYPYINLKIKRIKR